VAAQWEPGRLAVVGLGVAVAVAVVLFGLRVAWASGEGTVLAPGGGSRAGPTGISAGSAPVGAEPSGTAGTTGTAGAGVPPSPGASPSTDPGAAVVVHVVGEVRRPGLQRLPPGSRVADALQAAGGATRDADLARVNLARVLVDGEQVVVPAPGDPDPPGSPAPGGGTGTGTGSSGGGTPVSINTADLAGLDTLPGVGPVLAQRILDWRAEHGRFTTVDELGEVSGIGEKLMERLRPLVTL
jgi:competence protein ComEA